MTISPEAFDTARSILHPALFPTTYNYEQVIEKVAAALQAERDAAAPKLPDDLAGLVRLLKALATDHECNDEMDAASTCDQAATAIQSLVARIAELEAGLKDTAAALRSRLTADELNAPHHKPYEHPLSAYDRAARLLNKDRQP